MSQRVRAHISPLPPPARASMYVCIICIIVLSLLPYIDVHPLYRGRGARAGPRRDFIPAFFSPPSLPRRQRALEETEWQIPESAAAIISERASFVMHKG